MEIEMKKSVIILFLLPIIAGFAGCGDDNSGDANSANERDSVVIAMTADDSTDVLTLLQEEHDVQVKEGAMGSFVMAIDSLEGGNEVYWLYKVNGEMVPKAADKTMVGPGDKVTWHFHKMR